MNLGGKSEIYRGYRSFVPVRTQPGASFSASARSALRLARQERERAARQVPPAARKPARERVRRATRLKLLDGALRALVEQGIAKTSARSIATSAGLALWIEELEAFLTRLLAATP